MCGYLLILILQSKIKFSEGSLVTSEEEKKKKEVEVSASPFNPDCVSCQFYILGSFGNGSYKYKVEKALGAQKIKTRGKEDLCTEVGGTLEEFSQLICVWGGGVRGEGTKASQEESKSAPSFRKHEGHNVRWGTCSFLKK